MIAFGIQNDSWSCYFTYVILWNSNRIVMRQVANCTIIIITEATLKKKKCIYTYKILIFYMHRKIAFKQ